MTARTTTSRRPEDSDAVMGCSRAVSPVVVPTRTLGGGGATSLMVAGTRSAVNDTVKGGTGKAKVSAPTPADVFEANRSLVSGCRWHVRDVCLTDAVVSHLIRLPLQSWQPQDTPKLLFTRTGR